jgi:3-hydroxyisobutyrate dehydrogenase-like beta-hydroxyacid dehydrogenase
LRKATSERLGVIGLGQIGGSITRQLIAAGLRPAIYDTDPKAVRPHAADAVVAASPAAVAAEADIVLVAVLTSEQVEEVLLGPGGIHAAADEQTLAAVLSTISSPRFDQLRQAAAARRLTTIDCPVTGGVQAARQGRLVCLAGGTPEQVARVRASSASWASAVHHVGPAGSALKAKLARNLITYTIMAGVHDAVRLLADAGVDVGQVADAIRESDALTGGVAARLLTAAGAMRTDASAQPVGGTDHGLRTALKDLAAARELQEAASFPTTLTDLVAARMGGVYNS